MMVSLLAVAALAVAIASWFRPAPAADASASPQYNEQEIADANSAMCEAWDATYASMTTSGAKSSTDPTVAYIIGIQVQLAFHASGDYLQTKLQLHPATASELADAVTQLASSYHRIVLLRLADAPESDIDQIKEKMDAAETAVRRQCE
ncbi:hypothetical protein [Mycobacterium sp. ACS4331]|uniref:hypothetical protein n=1 Tax=Mycobacterium sp. ACS4331 TaxID=1834121 RepID=UPI0007FBF5EA|nr:hypothetical protein [Mycobacterium sp. ACS4331]OBF19413.1 hypothetical protein A5727_10450 [Mycobacterium sp. ACS4331]